MFLLVLLFACGSVEDTGLFEPLSLDVDIQPVLTRRCQDNCHSVEDPVSMSMTEGHDTYGELVNIAATQAPLYDRVEPYEPDLSYLWHKVNGTHLEVGGMGSQMPRRGELLESERAMIRRWIEEGAFP